MLVSVSMKVPLSSRYVYLFRIFCIIWLITLVFLQLGKEEPSVSMDNAGKVVFARNSEIVTTNIQAISTDEEFQDGQKIVAPVRDLGTTEIYAQSLQHSPNGR